MATYAQRQKQSEERREARNRAFRNDMIHANSHPAKRRFSTRVLQPVQVAVIDRHLARHKTDEWTVRPWPAGALEVWLDRNRLTFYVEYDGQKIEARSVDDLWSEVSLVVEDRSGMEWLPCIHVQEQQYSQGGLGERSFIDFTVDRYWVGQRSDGVWRRAEWTTPPEERLRRSVDLAMERTFALPYIEREGRPGYYLPYDEVLWQGLALLQRGVAQMRTKLHMLLSTDEGRVELLAALANGTPLLEG